MINRYSAGLSVLVAMFSNVNMNAMQNMGRRALLRGMHEGKGATHSIPQMHFVRSLYNSSEGDEVVQRLRALQAKAPAGREMSLRFLTSCLDARARALHHYNFLKTDKPSAESAMELNQTEEWLKKYDVRLIAMQKKLAKRFSHTLADGKKSRNKDYHDAARYGSMIMCGSFTGGFICLALASGR